MPRAKRTSHVRGLTDPVGAHPEDATPGFTTHDLRGTLVDKMCLSHGLANFVRIHTLVSIKYIDLTGL